MQRKATPTCFILVRKKSSSVSLCGATRATRLYIKDTSLLHHVKTEISVQSSLILASRSLLQISRMCCWSMAENIRSVEEVCHTALHLTGSMRETKNMQKDLKSPGEQMNIWCPRVRVSVMQLHVGCLSSGGLEYKLIPVFCNNYLLGSDANVQTSRL